MYEDGEVEPFRPSLPAVARIIQEHLANELGEYGPFISEILIERILQLEHEHYVRRGCNIIKLVVSPDEEDDEE